MEMENTFDIHISEIMILFHLTLFLNLLHQIVVYPRKCYPHCPIMQLQELCKVLEQLPTYFTNFHPFSMIQKFHPLPTLIHFQIPSKLKRLPYRKIFVHVIEYSFDVAWYIPWIFYLCDKKDSERIPSSSLVHCSCSWANVVVWIHMYGNIILWMKYFDVPNVDQWFSLNVRSQPKFNHLSFLSF
jgi:hypothetical protein